MTIGKPGAVAADHTALFDAFVHEESAALLRLAWGLTGERGGAEDLVQATFERVWTHWSRVSAKEHAGAYARRVTMTLFLTSRRRLWWRERVAASLPDESVEDSSDEIVIRRTMLEALSRLPARQRAVVVLRYLDDCSEAQTADALGCAPGTVKSHAARALAALRSNADLIDLWSPSLGGESDAR